MPQCMRTSCLWWAQGPGAKGCGRRRAQPPGGGHPGDRGGRWWGRVPASRRDRCSPRTRRWRPAHPPCVSGKGERHTHGWHFTCFDRPWKPARVRGVAMLRGSGGGEERCSVSPRFPCSGFRSHPAESGPPPASASGHAPVPRPRESPREQQGWGLGSRLTPGAAPPIPSQDLSHTRAGWCGRSAVWVSNPVPWLPRLLCRVPPSPGERAAARATLPAAVCTRHTQQLTAGAIPASPESRRRALSVYRILLCKMCTSSPTFLREKGGRAVDVGSTSSKSMFLILRLTLVRYEGKSRKQ